MAQEVNQQAIEEALGIEVGKDDDDDEDEEQEGTKKALHALHFALCTATCFVDAVWASLRMFMLAGRRAI